jgi:hypothetical protein
VIARELERNGATAHHWLSLPLETATYLYAQKRGDSRAD